VTHKLIRPGGALQSRTGWPSRHGWTLVAIVALVLDLGLTGITFFQIRLDGDLARVAGPVASYRPVLQDPLGLRSVTSGDRYPGAGRFMAHITTKLWSDFAISTLNVVVREPVRALYLTLALTAVFVQLLFVAIGCLYIRAFRPMAFGPTVICAAGLSMFVQFGKFYDFFGIIDFSVTYTMAYAIPILVLALFLYPVYRSLLSPDYRPALSITVCLIFAALYLAFSGPLVQPIVLLVGLLLLVGQLRNRSRLIVHWSLLPGLALLGLAGVWGMYIATFNSESEAAPSIGFRYRRLWRGLVELLVHQAPFWSMLVVGIAFQYRLVHRRIGAVELSRLRVHLVVCASFVVLWLALLPLGGFRRYRPLVLRYDTLLPVTIVAVYLFALTFRLAVSTVAPERLRNSSAFDRLWIIPALVLGLLVVIGKKPVWPLSNVCERHILESLRDTKGENLEVPRLCTVGTWSVNDLNDPDHQQALTKLLRRWQIIASNQNIK
jgi:hypothetical protein